MIKTIPIIFLLLVCGLAACAGTPKPELTLEQQLAQKHFKLLGPVKRVQDYRLMGWNKLDRQHVIMHSTPSRSYLITLRQPCHNLGTAYTIALSTTTGGLTRFDKLLVRDRASGYIESCLIEELHQLESTRASRKKQEPA